VTVPAQGAGKPCPALLLVMTCNTVRCPSTGANLVSQRGAACQGVVR
jgi:hypothetical protein